MSLHLDPSGAPMPSFIHCWVVYARPGHEPDCSTASFTLGPPEWIPVMLVLRHNGSSLWLADQIFMPSVTLVFVQAIPTPEPIFDSFDN